MRDFLTGFEGVASAKPFSGRRVAFAHNGRDINLYVIADDAENNVGAPARVVEGKAVPGKGEIIIDRVLPAARTSGSETPSRLPAGR